MFELGYLFACYILGSRYHTGQWSTGYAMMCMASMRAKRENSALDIGRAVELLNNQRIYPKGCEPRNIVAYWLKRMRHRRNTL